MDICEDRDLLRQLLLGEIPHDRAAALEQHVLGCPRCGSRLADIRAEDTLVAAARASRTMPDWGEDDHIRRLVEQLCRLPGPTVAPPDGPPDAPDVGAELQHYLDPAESPGELGRMGGYRVLRILGTGGMGIVLEAEDRQLARRVALKVMKPILAASPTAKARFLREARAAASIQHDNVVAIYQVGEHRGLPYLAMPLLAGESLASRLAREGKLPAATAMMIGRQIAAGLAAAHQRGIIHRDIKPDNIWLEATPGGERVKLLDFGLARVTDDATSLTQSGAVAGTPAYMSPEQARGEAVDHRSDLFSLGSVLYRMCVGRPPFEGTSTTAVLLAVTHQRPVAPRECDPAVPRRLSNLVMKLLEKEPARRLQSAAEVLAALDACGAGVSPAGATPSATPHTNAGGKPSDAGETPAPQRHQPRIVLIALAAALAGALAVAGLILRIATDQGTLVLELDQPDAAVTVDGREVTVRLPDGPIEITLPSGAHTMRVQKSGFTAYSEDFTVERGAKVVLRAKLVPERKPLPRDDSSHASTVIVAPLADGDAAVDWLRGHNSLTNSSMLIKDFMGYIRKQQDANRGFLYYFGHGLIKSRNTAIIGVHANRYFVCEVPADEDYPAMSAVGVIGLRNADRGEDRAELLDFTIEDPRGLTPDREIRGTVTLRGLTDKADDYAVRLTCLTDQSFQHVTWSPKKGAPAEKVSFRLLPLKGITRSGPVLAFLELCVFKSDDPQDFVVVSNPLAKVMVVKKGVKDVPD